MQENKPEIKLRQDKPNIRRFFDGMMNHFFTTFIILLIINVFFFTSKNVPILVDVIAFLLLIAYIIIFLVTRIQVNIRKLIHHELKFSGIVTAYVTSVIFMVLLFSILYWGMAFFGAGYLKYGSCVDTVELSKQIVDSDPLKVTEFMHYSYFSAITFFTVGFGDICPMGMSKIIATLNALIGNAFTVLILAIAITNYSTNKSNEKNNENKSETKPKNSKTK